MLEEEIISSVVSGLAEGMASNAGSSGGDSRKGNLSEKDRFASKRRMSIPAICLISLGVGMVALFAIAKLAQTISSIAPYVEMVPCILSIAMPLVGAVLIGLGIGFEVWDARRTWHRPMWRVKRELESALKMMHLTTASTIDSSTASIEGMRIDRYRWDSRTWSASVRLRHPGNTRLTLENLNRLAKANPFRYAHSVEVEPYLNRRKAPDGYTVRIFYRSDSETVDMQLEGGRPWQMK